MKSFLARLHQRRFQRIAGKALRLAPRGCVRNDRLVLSELSLISDRHLRIAWWARGVHPWDRDLPPSRQAELFSLLALHDTESALLRLFQLFPDIDQIDFQVLESPACPRIILVGNVERDEIPSARRSPSIRMRLLLMGVRFIMSGDHLEPIAA